MQVAFHPNYILPLPEHHRFPMLKYELLYNQLLHKGIIQESEVKQPEKMDPTLVCLSHHKDYVNKLLDLKLSKQEVRRSGFPLSKELIDRELCIMQGSYESASYALNHGTALNIAGGTHHAFSNAAEGFCLLNDLAIAVNILLKEGRIKSALIIDLDVHQGNGTAEIFARNKSVFTFSVHGASNFPMHKEKSDLDIALKNDTEDQEYLKIIRTQVSNLLDSLKPDIVAYQAGVDILKTDKLGKLNMSMEGCLERDRIVFSYCAKRDIPIFAAMGGGYSPKISDIVNAHSNTFEVARYYY